MGIREKSKMQQNFEAERVEYTERDIQMEILFSNRLIQSAVEKTRANTSTIVWIIVAGIILSIIIAILLNI